MNDILWRVILIACSITDGKEYCAERTTYFPQPRTEPSLESCLAALREQPTGNTSVLSSGNERLTYICIRVENQ